MKTLILVVFVILTQSATSQWQQVFNGTTTIRDFTTSGSNIFAATSSTGVYLSTNNGTNWTQTSLVMTVYSLASSGNTVYAGGSGNGVYRTINNGVNWVQTSLNNQFILTLAVIGNTIFAGTGSPQNDVYISTNAGDNWSMVSDPGGDVFSLAIGGNYTFAGCGPNGIYRTSNNGANWTQTSLNSGIFYDIETNGSLIYAGSTSGLFLSTNYGSNWTETSLSTQVIYSIAVNGNNIFAATGNSGVYVSNNNGTNWIQRSEGLSGFNVQNLYILNNYIFAGAFSGSILRRSLSEITGITNLSSETPSSFSLSQNYPNPFNPVTNIEFSVPKSSFVKLAVFDITGREIETLVNQNMTAGTYKADWDASRYSSGIYFYTISSESYRETKKMMLVK
jgi:photosystem II stability/assembly factor-like uncharacterized protein